MKKSLLFLLIPVLICNIGWAQVPDKFNYQAVIRNDAGELITGQNVDVQISILNNSPEGVLLYQESHSKSTNAYGIVNLVIGDGIDKTGDLLQINWGLSDKYLKVEVDAGSGLTNIGTVQLLSVPYSLFAETADSARVASMAYTANKADVLGSNGVYSTSTDTLFVVKDHSGNVVFAVFPDGAQVIVNEAAKGKVGGFAVSGRSPSKAVDVDILKITQDSTRIYVNDTVNAKGKVGGFAVSGRSPSKSASTDILFITADSTRIYVNDDPAAKGKVGGFAVSGRSPSKTITNSYLQVFPDSTRIFVKDSVAGFGVANIEGGASESFLNLNKQNYFIGHQTGGNNTDGKYNSMIGYQAGYTNSFGSNNLFLGYKAGYLNTNGGNNVFIGTESGYHNQNTFQNTYVGYRSGYDLSGAGNTVMGSMAGENASGGNNTFIGTSAGRIATGGNNTFVGNGAGYGFPDENTGVRNTYIGQASGSKTTTGSYNVMLGFNTGNLNYEGSRNTFLGYDAGHNIHEGSGNIFIGYNAGKNIDGINDRLIIENSSADSTSAMIYGDFNKNQLRINSVVGINTNASTGYGLIVNGGSSGSYSIYAYKGGYTPGSWFGASDIRLKKDISNIKNSLNIIKSINGVVFNWKVEEFPEMQLSSRHQIGVIAQDIEKVLPELVSEDEQGFKAVAYDKLSAVFIEAIKEQQTQIEKLESENKDLHERLKKLEDLMLK